MIVFFNREEDGFLGSSEFVAHLARRRGWHIKEAHIFEMVGYRDQALGSQTVGITHPHSGCSGAISGMPMTLAASQIASWSLSFLCSLF